jgi:hypothetical protein
MAYNTQVLFEKAKEQIVSKRLIFIEEVATFIGISKPTLYEHFPIDSNELNELKKLIEDNKITLKTSMRKKWYDSDNATLQMGLMKLIATPEEHKRLATNFNDHTTNGVSIKQTIMQVEIVKPNEEDEE